LSRQQEAVTALLDQRGIIGSTFVRSPLISGNLPLMHNLFVAVTAIDTSNQLGNDVQQIT
jgi:hypothetical protein